MDTTIFLTEDNIKQVVSELIINECNEYVNILTKNYYAEELMLENLLDALLKGDIFDHKYDVECLSGHSKLSFETEKTLSFDEVLADYDTIKNSSKANILINKLRTLVGNRLVDYLDNYIEEYRNSKDILDKRIESTFTDENELIKVKKK